MARPTPAARHWARAVVLVVIGLVVAFSVGEPLLGLGFVVLGIAYAGYLVTRTG